MVISLNLLTTIISTIIAVTMASIFFRCWSKKRSGEIKDRKAKLSKEESTKDKSASSPKDKLASFPTPTVGKSKNGEVKEIKSESECGIKTPLLSPSPLEDSTEEDLADFSAVQRETEILRTYRKPPPPKRAKQSRVPRALQTDTKSLDIFTELHEEDSSHSSDKTNNDSNEDIDNITLRQSKEKIRPDTRSSMLADIEQTLAALHTVEQSPVPPVEGKFGFLGLTPKGDAQGKVTVKKKPESETSISAASEDKHRPSQLPLSSKNKTESSSPTAKESPKIGPIAKPRQGPSVSPKPSPKARSKLSCHEDAAIANTTVEKSSDTVDNVPQPQPRPRKSEEKVQQKDVELPDRITLARSAVSDTEITTNDNQILSHSRSEQSEKVTHPNLESTEEKKYENKTVCPDISSEVIASSDTTKTTRHDVIGEIFPQEAVKDISKSTDIKEKEEKTLSGNELKSEGNAVIDTAFDKEATEDISKSIDVKENQKKSFSGNQLESEGNDVADGVFDKEAVKDISNKNTDITEKEVKSLSGIQLKSEGNDVVDTVFDKKAVEDISNSINVKENEEKSLFENQLKSEGNDVVDAVFYKEVVEDISKSTDVKEKEVESLSGNQLKSEGHNIVLNEEETVDPSNDQELRNDSDKSTTTYIKDEPAEDAAPPASPDSETPSCQIGGTSRASRSQETGKQRRESSEDQTGKGKISKIPVRAGSKPRSSSPKKASSPTEEVRPEPKF